jgi:tetratricopeptide (TPR) repeat protein
LVSLLFIIVVGTFALQPKIPNDPLQKEFEQTKRELAQNPTNPKLHLGLARIYEKANDLRKAKEEIFTALQYSPQDKLIQENLKEIKKLEQKPQEIREEIAKWEGVASLYPNYRDAWFRLSILYWQIFDEKKTESALEKVLELDPNFEPAENFRKLIN